MKLAVIGTAVVAVALGAGACGGDSESQASAEQSMCQALGNYASAVAGLQGLSLESTKSDIQSQTDAVQDAWNGVTSAAQDLGSADTSAIESAQSSLQDAVGNLSDDTTVAQAAQDLQPQIQALPQAYKETYDGLDCASLLTSTTSS
jgi:uncharacterized protein YukE